MAKSSQRAQKAGQKAAKRRQVVALKKRSEGTVAGLAGRIAVAAAHPIVHCMRTGSLFASGIGYVIVARELPTHLLSCVFFLVDVYCLGVKDIHHGDLSPLDLKKRLDDMAKSVDGYVAMDPPCARKLVRDSVAYAARAKLRPAKDFAIIEGIFGDIDANGCTEAFTFGQDGKPFYVAGPNDTPARIREIMAALGQAFPPGAWDYMIPLPDENDEFLASALDDDDLHVGPIIDHDPDPPA